MSELKNRYHAILQDIENHIQDEQEKKYVIEKFQELSMVFMDIIDRLTYMNDIKMKEIEERQHEIDSKLDEVKQSVDGIESDIYEEGEDYEFEIICPYCNYQFLADISSEANTEVECPECHNVIELDWNGEEECEHECSHCMHDCSGAEELVYEEDDDVEADKDEETAIEQKAKTPNKPTKQEKVEKNEAKPIENAEDEEDDM